MAYDDHDYPTEHADKFIWEPGDVEVLGMCLSGVHKHGGANTCDAYPGPGRIPDAIQAGTHDHRLECHGDLGVRLEAVPGVDIDRTWRLRRAEAR